MKNKITENIVANVLSYLLDNHEFQPLSEEKLREIGYKFLESDYNKSDVGNDGILERVEEWIRRVFSK